MSSRPNYSFQRTHIRYAASHRKIQALGTAKQLATLLALVGLVQPIPSRADDLPWAFQNGQGQGYSLEPVAADPLPGQPVCAGAKQFFGVAVKYHLEARAVGKIILVFQDEANHLIGGKDAPQTSKDISKGEGTVALNAQITVPSAKEVRLFVPLVPSGMERTEGELVLRFPVKVCK